MRPVSQQGRVATLLLEGGLGLEDALDDGSLLDEESAGDALLDAARADGAAVGARNGLLALREAGVLAGAEGGDTGEGLTAVTALGSRLGLLAIWCWESVAAGGRRSRDGRRVRKRLVRATTRKQHATRTRPRAPVSLFSRHPSLLAVLLLAAGARTETNSKLLDVVDNELAARGLDDTPAVRGRVVGLALAESDTLGHSGRRC